MLILRCPCGCGDDLLVNLDTRVGHAWRYYSTRRGLTLFPSYWREGNCGSHFIIWNDHIYWCYGRESDDWSVSEAIEEAVLAALPDDRFVNYVDLADRLGLIPWEALQACRQLVKSAFGLQNFEESLSSYASHSTLFCKRVPVICSLPRQFLNMRRGGSAGKNPGRDRQNLV